MVSAEGTIKGLPKSWSKLCSVSVACTLFFQCIFSWLLGMKGSVWFSKKKKKQSISSGWPFGFYAKNSIFASRKLNKEKSGLNCFKLEG